MQGPAHQPAQKDPLLVFGNDRRGKHFTRQLSEKARENSNVGHSAQLKQQPS